MFWARPRAFLIPFWAWGLFFVGCQHKPVVIPPVATAALNPPLGQAAATAPSLPLLGSPVVTVTGPSSGFTNVIFTAIPGVMPTGAGVLGFVTPLGNYVAIGLDPQFSIYLDATGPYPVLKATQAPVLQHTPVTFREIFTIQPDNTWQSSSSVVFDIPLPNIPALIQVFRNGLLVLESDYTIGYDLNKARLTITPLVTWSPADKVRGVWVL